MISGIPALVPQVTIDLEVGSTSIYCTVDSEFKFSLSFFGNGFLWHGGGFNDWQYKKPGKMVDTINNCYNIA
jgi:hypothetical protein